MAQLLIITTLDVAGRRNNREHHVIARLGPAFERVTVVYRRRGAAGKRGRDLLRGTVETVVRDGVTWVGVDPALNPPEGTVRNFAAGQGADVWRRAMGGVLDVAGILRDRLTIRALTRAARGVVADGMPVVCEAFGPWAAAAAQSLRCEGRIARYVYVDRDYEPGFMNAALRRDWAERAERRAAAGADLTLSIGHRLAARFAGNGTQVEISPTGVDGGLFTPRLRNVPEPHLIFVGQVAPWSGIEEVLEAVGLLGPDIRLTMLGPADSSYRAHLAPRMAALGQQVDWRGDLPRDQVAAALAAAGIGIATFRPHPLRIHAAPLKLLEYMASGLPVIALEGSEAGDMVLRTKTGLTCATTGAAIAQAVRRMMVDAAAYAAMSAAGPVVAAAHDWGVVLGRERALLAQLYGLDLT